MYLALGLAIKCSLQGVFSVNPKQSSALGEGTYGPALVCPVAGGMFLQSLLRVVMSAAESRLVVVYTV
jgi:hypothetical protein